MRAGAPLALLLGLLASRVQAGDLAERAARSYAIDTSGSTATLTAGQRGRFVLAIRTEPGVHVQAQAPLRVTLSAPDGLALAAERLGWPDAAPGEAPRFEVAFTATRAGRHAARARLEFFLCSDAGCVKQDREVALPVDVAPAATGASG
jgi:hypothetical protein